MITKHNDTAGTMDRIGDTLYNVTSFDFQNNYKSEFPNRILLWLLTLSGVPECHVIIGLDKILNEEQSYYSWDFDASELSLQL